jgi:hypothetical protein
MRFLILMMFGLGLLHSANAQSEGFQVGIGAFTLASDGVDIQISYGPPQSHYQFGYKYVHWTDVFHDPYTGNAHSSTTETHEGPVLIYRIDAEADATYYVGVALLKWTRTETPIITTDPPNTSSTTDLYFGGGRTGKIGNNAYYNLGMFIAPSASMNTQTAISSEHSNGNFDIQLQIGLAF